MSKVFDSIIGLTVGDALGVPYEFKGRWQIACTDLDGYGTWNQPKGTWSDDTSMTLATLESIGTLGRIDEDDIMKNFVKWLKCGAFTARGKVFDVGLTTRLAITNYLKNRDVSKCGLKGMNNNGNSSLMRILPLVFVDPTREEICKVSSLTHSHPISVQACQIYVDIVSQLLQEKTLKKSIDYSLSNQPNILKEFERLYYLDELQLKDIQSSGYVVHTLEAALWCLIKTNNYRDATLLAVNLGEDTDTTAAVTGGIAGLMYGVGGENGIPMNWVYQIARLNYIWKLCKMFEKGALNND